MSRKSLRSFASGFLCAVLLLGCVTGALAASGAVHYNSVGLKVNGVSAFTKGKDIINDAGNAVPASILYEDEAGLGTTYVPLAYVSRLLDTQVGWDAENGTVLLGSTGGGGISFGIGSNPAAPLSEMPTTSVGSQAAPFTEIAPRLPQGDEKYSLPISSTSYRSVDGYQRSFSITPDNGKYLSVTVTNHNDFPLLLRLGRSYNQSQVMIPTQIPAGQTVTRTFEIGKSDLLTTLPRFQVFVGSNGQWSEIDITVEAVQFGKDL